MKIEFIKAFKDLTGKVHHITRAKRHWWSSWVISIDGRSPYDYRIDKDGKFKQVLHKFPGVTIPKNEERHVLSGRHRYLSTEDVAKTREIY